MQQMCNQISCVVQGYLTKEAQKLGSTLAFQGGLPEETPDTGEVKRNRQHFTDKL